MDTKLSLNQSLVIFYNKLPLKMNDKHSGSIIVKKRCIYLYLKF